MTTYKKFLQLGAGCLVVLMGLVSCSPTVNEGQTQSSSRKQSLKRDSLGHRPGPKGFTTVIIDAGHGGRDSGAIGNRLSEKEVALDTAKRLKKKLSGKFRVVMLRKGDRFVDLDDRVKAASRYSSAVLISLHYNHSRSSYVRGPETYYWRVDSYSLATRIQNELERVTGGRRSGLGKNRRRLRLTRNPKVPSVLVELGYLSNTSEARKIQSSAYRDRLASAVADAIIDQSRLGDRGTGRLPRPLNQPLSKSTDRPGS